MEWSLVFVFNSVLLGVGLAMDAFSVSLANGLNEPRMKGGRMCGIAGVFSGFQFLMPLVGWFCVHTIAQRFAVFEKLIPWIALILLLYIGGKMIAEARSCNCDASCMGVRLKPSDLMVQGIATSIDALSVGFTIADYGIEMAFAACLIIGAVTFVICMGGLAIGKKFGTHLSGKASALGGAILIAIGIEIFLTGVF